MASLRVLSVKVYKTLDKNISNHIDEARKPKAAQIHKLVHRPPLWCLILKTFENYDEQCL